ncbi:ABC transporter permease, partial [Anaerostipes sp.]|uniref:ABC transporter permease n=1 Tax=Anaerostipes sp. TaxID=1872530 RepID=UPI003966B5E0
MEKVLRKRAWRDLKENKIRYLALAFLIIISMYLVISLIGAADTIIDGTARQAKKHKLEDGQFQVFVPLTRKQKENLTKKGITLEETFYLDFRQKDGSKLRIFQNRKKVDKINLDAGRLAKNKREAVIEKRYAQEHNLKIGSKITIDGNSYKITGVGSVPDYDACYEKLSDSTVDSKQFGLAFVTEDAYQNLKENENSIQSEEYIYAYRLNGAMPQKQLKNKLKKITFNPDDVDDPYFKDYWKETAGKKDDIKDGIRKLTDASTQMSDGLKKLSENNETLQKGADQIFQTYLKTAGSQLASFGITSLTENNYASILKSLITKSNDGLTRLSLESAKEQLDALKTYRDGIKAYTNGVEKASDGSKKLKKGTDRLEEGTEELMKAFDMETSNLTQFLKADDNTRIGAAANDQVINKFAGMVAGVIIMILFTYVISVFVIHGIEKESSIIGTLYALGVTKKQLLKYYLTVPVIVTFFAGLVGMVVGYSPLGIPVQMQDCYDYCSIPDLTPEILVYLLIYGVIMPPLIAVIVNYFVIRKKLSRPALSMIRNEQKKNHISKVKLGDMPFLTKFRIRQSLREARAGFTVVFGMFIALLIMMLGLDCYVMCDYISKENKRDTEFEYMYTYKYPDKKVPEGGDACFVKGLHKEVWGYDLEISLVGIEKDNPYFSQDKDLP